MWLLNQVGSSQWEPCLLSCFGRNIAYLPRSWKRPLGPFQGSAQESHWNEEGPFAAVLLENHCPHKQMAIFQLVLKEWGRKEGSFFLTLNTWSFQDGAGLSLHTSTISKGTRLWEALCPLWQCVQNAVQGCREGTVFPVSWVAFPPGIHVALEWPSSQEQGSLSPPFLFLFSFPSSTHYHLWGWDFVWSCRHLGNTFDSINKLCPDNNEYVLCDSIL